MGTEKHPLMAEDDTEHKYEDKYCLAEFVTNTSLAAQLCVLENLGLTYEHLKTVLQWVQEEKETVTLFFQAQDGCSFLKEQEVALSSTEIQKETTTTAETTAQSASFFGSPSPATKTEKTVQRVVQKVKEYHWKVYVSYTLKIYKGTDMSSAIELQTRNASTVLVTSGGQATMGRGPNNNRPISPIAEKTVHPSTEVSLTWLFQTLDKEQKTSQFSIDRSVETCKTPRRNGPVEASIKFHQSLVHWILATLNFFLDRMEREILAKHNPASVPTSRLEPGTKCQMIGIEKDQSFNGKVVVIREYIPSADRYRAEPFNPADGLPGSLTIRRTNLSVQNPSATGPMLSSVTVEDIFTPVLPLLEGGSVLEMPDANQLLEAQKSSIERSFETQIATTFPPRQLAKLASQAEAMILLLSTHWLDIIEHYQNCINYIEDMLRRQLIQAIGKEVNADDFNTFMRFHQQKLFGPDYAPKPFVHSIRRPNHYPDGILSIESTLGSNQSINTMVRHVSGTESSPISIPINAATSIEMVGDRYLHGWMQHRFDGADVADYRIAARARQFSSFLLVLGTMAGADKFDPKAAVILQNKDEVIIPLLTNVLPTAKEFKDAIASLSPEQQAFAKAFRGMQLESSVFGVCVIQLKTQLEKLLGLSPGSLTKEIQLTQDLMSLFVDYQIPSDMLTFEGDISATSQEKLSAVKGHVKVVKDVITAEKEQQLLEEQRRADMRAEMRYAQDRAEAEEDEFESIEEESVGTSMMGQVQDAMADAMVMSASVPRMKKSPPRRALAGRGQGGPPRMMAKKMAAPPPPPKAHMSMTVEKVQPQPVTQKSAAEQSSRMPQESTLPETTTPHAGPTSAEDFTLVPKVLDDKFGKLDSDNALRSTILTPGMVWTRKRQENLLSKPKLTNLRQPDLDSEKNKAFDLLDAISRSGTLPIECAELHVIIAVSHCFANDVMGTVIQDGVNPIERVEKSCLMVGSTIFGKSTSELLANSVHKERLTNKFPTLFLTE